MEGELAIGMFTQRVSYNPLLPVQLDTCRKSCKECESCASTDYDCLNRNRKKGGYLEIDREEMKWLGANVWQQTDPSPEL